MKKNEHETIENKTDEEYEPFKRFENEKIKDYTSEELYEKLFGEKNNIKNSKPNFNELTQGYDISDFFEFDIKKETSDKNVKNKKKIRTSLFEKIIYFGLSVDPIRQEDFFKNLKEKYLKRSNLTIEKAVIENYSEILNSAHLEYSQASLKNKEASTKIYQKISELTEIRSECSDLITKSENEIQDLKEKLESNEKELEHAYNSKNGSKYMKIIEKEQLSYVEKINTKARNAKRAMYSMKQYDNQIQTLEKRKIEYDKRYNFISNRKSKIELLINFLDIAKEQKNINDLVEDFDPNYNPNVIKDGSQAIEKLMNITDKVYENLDEIERKDDRILENTILNTDNNYQEINNLDIEKISAIGTQLQNQIREREYQRVKNIIK